MYSTYHAEAPLFAAGPCLLGLGDVLALLGAPRPPVAVDARRRVRVGALQVTSHVHSRAHLGTLK